MKKILTILGPGMLVAATGVGAGDLATSALAGAHIGVVAIWAVLIGGVMKLILNEGLTRYQLDTQNTLLKGALQVMPKWVRVAFLIYLIAWSFTVAVALVSANGVAMHALWPVFDDSSQAKIIFGVILSLLGWVLVRVGGFQVFEKFMSVSVLLMVFTVLYTLFQFEFDIPKPTHALTSITDISWFIATMGGVGGTVTVLCYGYWINEHNRKGPEGMKQSRLDLRLAYGTTVLLGIGMVLVGTQIQIDGGGAGLLIKLSDILEQQSGTIPALIFRVGAFAAIFSSLLGVWQSVPYLFEDVLDNLLPNKSKSHYPLILGLLAVVPLLGLPLGFASMQKLYALCGALFVPMLAGVLSYLALRSPAFKPPKYVIAGYLVVFTVFMGLLWRWLMG